MTTETIAPTRWDEARLKSNLLAGLIRDRAENLGDRNYLEDARGDRRLSFLALESAVHGWAKQFDESGLSRGVVVAIAIADPIAFSAAFLAIIASGRWVAPLDPGAPIVGAAGLATASARVQADFLIADRPFSRESRVSRSGTMRLLSLESQLREATWADLTSPLQPLLGREPGMEERYFRHRAQLGLPS